MCVNCPSLGARWLHPAPLARRGFVVAALGLGIGVVTRPARAQSLAGLPLVMLDPGHGGHDPGAISPEGAFEKDITLACAFALRDDLLATGRYRVAMTRVGDVYVTLEARVAAAVGAGADLFLAMHCDHLPSADGRGASVFTLSSQASDALAAGVAQEQNAADCRPGELAGISPQVAGILASLESRATRIASATMAADIQASFNGVIPLLPDPHRSADFAVLRDPTTPSTLLEMGCLTNKLDEQLLTSPAHREVIAARLTSAIDQYFNAYAPAGQAPNQDVRVAG